MAEKPKQEYHWFTSSQVNWAADDSLTTCLIRQRKADKGIVMGCTVWKIPGDCKTTNYPIEFYQPKIEGAEFIGEEVY